MSISDHPLFVTRKSWTYPHLWNALRYYSYLLEYSQYLVTNTWNSWHKWGQTNLFIYRPPLICHTSSLRDVIYEMPLDDYLDFGVVEDLSSWRYNWPLDSSLIGSFDESMLRPKIEIFYSSQLVGKKSILLVGTNFYGSDSKRLVSLT